MRIKMDETAALIIDYQERLVPAMHNKDELIRNSRILIEGLQVLGVPLIVSTQYKKGLKETIPEISEAASGAETIDKISFSCFDEEKIREAFKGRKTIIVCGIEAHVCVLQTVIDLCAAGYHVVLVEDCIDSRRENDKRIALRRAEAEGAMLTTYEAILFELTRYAGTDRFREISALIK